MVLWRTRRPLVALQVEVTSRCTRRCECCPRSVLDETWIEGDMSAATWERIRPDLGLAVHVHLQGWGEPLLHPRLRTMVGDAREAGCEVGLTTNGDHLPEAAGWLVEERVARVAVSVAGNEERHRAWRNGSSLECLWEAVGELRRHRGRRRKPKIQVAYLLTRDNATDLAETVVRASEQGADELFVIHLDCLPAERLAAQAAFSCGGVAPEVLAAIAAARAASRSHGLRFRPPAIAAADLLVCALDPRSFIFVGWDGRAGPCVNLLPPIAGSMPRVTEDGTVAIDPVVLGNLRESRLHEIVGGELRVRFTAPFEARTAAESRFRRQAGDGWGPAALERLEEADAKRARALALNPFPDACRGCPKAMGW